MKRFFILSVSMVPALSSFAYYGDYSSPSLKMPGWLTFMGIIMIVWGILEIILFFKIWGMTDNIKALTKDHFTETEFESKWSKLRFLRRNLVLGNKDTVKRVLLKNFMDNVEKGYGDLPTGGYEKDENGNQVWVRFEQKNKKASIRPYVENLKQQYDKIGEELPVYIQRMETFGDYFDLFVEDDLVVKVEKESDK